MLLSILKWLWPFVKEMFLGKNSLRYALRKNRIRVFTALLVMASFVTNYYTLPKMVKYSDEQLTHEKELKKARADIETYKRAMLVVDSEKANLAKRDEEIKDLKEELETLKTDKETLEGKLSNTKEKTCQSDYTQHVEKPKNVPTTIAKHHEGRDTTSIRDRLNLEN